MRGEGVAGSQPIVQLYTGAQISQAILFAFRTSSHLTVNNAHKFLDWQWPLSGVHSIMTVNSAQPGGGGGCTSSPLHSIYHHEQSCSVFSSLEGRYTPISPLYPFLLSGVESDSVCMTSEIQLNLCTQQPNGGSSNRPPHSGTSTTYSLLLLDSFLDAERGRRELATHTKITH